MKCDHIYIWGDSHGDYSRLANFVKQQMPSNSVICHVGDWGRGFTANAGAPIWLAKINEGLSEKNSEIFVIRGNHDIPSDFDGRQEGLITFLRDYTFMDINDERFGFIGGAVSIDKLYREEGVSYWKGEGFVLHKDKCQPCDTLIIHSSPIECPPVDSFERLEEIVGQFVPPETPRLKIKGLVQELLDERVEISKMAALCKPNCLYYGHFHFSETFINDNYRATLLDIDECIKHL